MNEKLQQVKNILETDGKRIYFIANENGDISLSHVLEIIAREWNVCSGTQKKELANILLSNNKNYLGDIKWSLYQHVCDIGEIEENYEIGFICGKYAYNKISYMNGFSKYEGIEFTPKTFLKNSKKEGTLNLNGEEINIYKNNELDKKKLIIFKRDSITRAGCEGNNPMEILYELYFA